MRAMAQLIGIVRFPVFPSWCLAIDSHTFTCDGQCSIYSNYSFMTKYLTNVAWSWHQSLNTKTFQYDSCKYTRLVLKEA